MIQHVLFFLFAAVALGDENACDVNLSGWKFFCPTLNNRTGCNGSVTIRVGPTSESPTTPLRYCQMMTPIVFRTVTVTCTPDSPTWECKDAVCMSMSVIVPMPFVSIAFQGCRITGSLSLINPNMRMSLTDCVFDFMNRGNFMFQSGSEEVPASNASTLVVHNSTFRYGKGDEAGCLQVFEVPIVRITHSLFENCVALYSGGAVRIYYYSSITSRLIEANITFAGNTLQHSRSAYVGGCLAFGGRDEAFTRPVVVDQCVFRNCTTGKQGGAISIGDGMGVYANLTIKSTIFENSTANIGGAVYAGTPIFAMEDSSFTGNVASADGGAIVVHGYTTATITNTTFVACEAGELGGAVKMFDPSPASSAVISNCIFDSCSAVTSGGAVYQGGMNSTLLVEHTSFQMCVSNSGGGVGANQSIAGLRLQNASFRDCYWPCYEAPVRSLKVDELTLCANTSGGTTTIPANTTNVSTASPSVNMSNVVSIARRATHVRTVVLASMGLSIATQALVMDVTGVTSFAAGGLVARTSAIDDVAQCDGGSFPEPSVHPTQVSFAGGPLAPYLGAIVMNTVLVVAFQLLCVGVFRSLETFPGFGLYLLLYFFLTQLQFSVRIVWDERREWFHACSGVAVAVACVAFFCGVAWLVRTQSFLTSKRWRPLFESYVPHRHYFVLVELSSQAFIAIATAYLTSDRNICTTQAVACAAISILHLVALIVLRPYILYVHLVAYCAVDVAAFVGSVLAALGRYDDEEIVSVVSMLIVVVVVVYDGVQPLIAYWRAWRTASGTQVPEVATEMKNASALEHALVSDGPSPPTHDMPPPPPTRTVKHTPQHQQQDTELDSLGVPPPKNKKKVIIDDTL